jgi:hypothetical protein
MTASPLAKAICCEGAPCMRPDSCDAGRHSRAAAAVERLLCERWSAMANNTSPKDEAP